MPDADAHREGGLVLCHGFQGLGCAASTKLLALVTDRRDEPGNMDVAQSHQLTFWRKVNCGKLFFFEGKPLPFFPKEIATGVDGGRITVC